MFKTIELHFSNKCTADCVVCSKAHGGGQQPFMDEDVLCSIIEKVGRLGFAPNLQLGGDGDAFMHPYFLDWCAELKERLPESWRCLYTNGFLLDERRQSMIWHNGLINEIQIRIDSLDLAVYHQSTGLFLERTKENIERMARRMNGVKVCLIYMPLYQYADTCWSVLGREPAHFGRVEQHRLRNEWPEVKAWADGLGLESRVTGISLWAERAAGEFVSYPCPRLPGNFPGDMENQVYIYPNGNIGMCGYDDGQCVFQCGNIKTDSLVWAYKNGLDTVTKFVRNRNKDGYPTCCVDARCCVMWERDDNDNPINPEEKYGRPR